MSKFSKKFLSSLIVHTRSFFRGTVAAKFPLRAVRIDTGTPFTKFLVPTHPLESARVVNCKPDVVHILRARTLAKILSTIIQRIMVSVVNLPAASKDETMHHNRLAVFPFPSQGVKGSPCRTPHGHPIPLVQPFKISGIHDGVLPFRKWNNAVGWVRRLSNGMPLTSVFRHGLTSSKVLQLSRYSIIFAAFFILPSAHAQGTQIVTLASDPATCTTGMTYYNSTSNTLKSCGPNNTWAAAGGGITSVSSLPGTCTPGVTAPVTLSVPPFGIFYCSATNVWSSSADVLKAVTCVGCKADLQAVNDATVTNGSSSITTSGGDIAFTSGDTAKSCFATTGGGPALGHVTGKLSLPRGTFTQTGAHTGTCSTTANANASGAATNYFFWGTDDAAALATWWTAITPTGALCKTGLLPATATLTTTNFGSAAAPACKTAITGSGNEGVSIQGFGQLDSLLVMAPDFDPATCSSACLFAGVGISLSNFGIWGAERSDCPATFNGKNLTNINTDTHIFDVQFTGWCASTSSNTTGVATTGAGSAAQQSGWIIDGFGSVCYTVSVSFIPIVNSWFGDCQSSDVFVNGATFPSVNNTFGDISASGIMVSVTGGAGSVFQSTGDSCFEAGTTVAVGVKLTANALANIENMRCDVSGSTTNVSVWVNGGRANVIMSRLKGGATGSDVLVDTSGIYQDLGANSYLATRFNMTAGASTLIADGSSLTGACTGVATAASTLGLYGTGPNETLTTCTSTTIGSGAVVGQVRTLMNLVVTASAAGTNASSGLVTVLKNGVATTIVCTIGTGTSCVDNTHSVALVAGDLISFNFTSQAADTLAGVKAFVRWN